ncbi:hypothetical protein JCM3770_007464 [Rhodotorula araucariae]
MGALAMRKRTYTPAVRLVRPFLVRLRQAAQSFLAVQDDPFAANAVVGIPDELTGQAVVAFVTLKPEFAAENPDEPALLKELVLQVRKTIGPFASPKKLVLIGDLPKTRSGKIVRMALRKIASGEGDQLGNLSTLAEPTISDEIKSRFAQA